MTRSEITVGSLFADPRERAMVRRRRGMEMSAESWMSTNKPDADVSLEPKSDPE